MGRDSGSSTTITENDFNSDTAHIGCYYTIAFDTVTSEGLGRLEHEAKVRGLAERTAESSAE